MAPTRKASHAILTHFFSEKKNNEDSTHTHTRKCRRTCFNWRSDVYGSLNRALLIRPRAVLSSMHRKYNPRISYFNCMNFWAPSTFGVDNGNKKTSVKHLSLRKIFRPTVSPTIHLIFPVPFSFQINGLDPKKRNDSRHSNETFPPRRGGWKFPKVAVEHDNIVIEGKLGTWTSNKIYRRIFMNRAIISDDSPLTLGGKTIVESIPGRTIYSIVFHWQERWLLNFVNFSRDNHLLKVESPTGA